jgi:hypothetical protein
MGSSDEEAELDTRPKFDVRLDSLDTRVLLHSLLPLFKLKLLAPKPLVP